MASVEKLLPESMLSFPAESSLPLRPTMRRKSSAQNLLASFKSNNNSGGPVPAPTPSPGASTPSLPQQQFQQQQQSVGHPSGSGSSLTYNPTPASVSTPVAITPMMRDWDAQSLHDGLATASTGAAPPASQGTSVEYLRDLIQKRIVTLTYIRSIHEGHSHWFHTILVTRVELERVFNNTEMRKRTSRFAVLGLSLSNLLDIQHPQDLLRALMNTLTEYDQSKEDNEKSMAKMRQPKRLFRAKGGKRQGGFSEYSGALADTYTDASYLVAPQIPFPLDYHQTLLSLIDVLSEVYNRISKLLGPSPFPHSAHINMAGPLGLLAPRPGVSYLFPPAQHPNDPYAYGQQQGNGFPYNQEGLSDQEISGSLWGIAHGGPGAVNGAGLASPPPTWTPAYGDMLLKIDGKFKKIISTLLKELDQFARNAIKDELASLDPLLRNVMPQGGPDELGRNPMYDFEGM